MQSDIDERLIKWSPVASNANKSLKIDDRMVKWTPVGEVDPTSDMSATDRVLAGTGRGMASVMRAIGMTDTLKRMGLPATAEEAANLDKPLLNTTGGKVGNFIGVAAPSVVAGMLPGSQTMVGAIGWQALSGGLTTEGGLADRAKAAVLGGAGGGAGKWIGDRLPSWVQMATDRMRDSRLTTQTANAGKDAAAQTAKQAGYVIPPADVRPSMINEVLNGMSGKIKTAQEASVRNQGTTNDLVKQAIGIAPDQPITSDALRVLRAQAGQDYATVAGSGVVTPTKAYAQTLDDIVAPFVKASQGFPNAKANPLIAEIQALKSNSFDAGSAVGKVRELRDLADAAYRAGSKEAGSAYKRAAGALEDELETHLRSLGNPEAIKAFRDARQQIAKTYSVEKALNATTGDVSATVLAKQLEKGRPLSGELLTVAQVAQAFPKATQTLKEAPKQLSPLDYAVGAGTGLASGSPMAALLPLIRPAARSVILSQPYQRAMVNPGGYGAGLLETALPALASEPVRRALPISGGLLSADFAQ